MVTNGFVEDNCKSQVGTAVSGVAFATVGYFGIFGAGAVCDTLGVLYVAFVLKGQTLMFDTVILDR